MIRGALRMACINTTLHARQHKVNASKWSMAVQHPSFLAQRTFIRSSYLYVWNVRWHSLSLSAVSTSIRRYILCHMHSVLRRLPENVCFCSVYLSNSTKGNIFSVMWVTRLYNESQKSDKVSGWEWNWVALFRVQINTGTWPYRLEESQNWDNRVW